MAKPSLDRAHLGVIIACTIGNALNTTSAVHAVFGVFLVPLSQTFAWPRASISAALGLVALAGAILYPLAGAFADRHGARRMLIVGNVLFAMALAALALTNGSLAQFYLTFAAIGIAGAIPNNAVFTRVVTEWFVKNRGVMLGISGGVGNSLGATILPIVAAVLMATFGWRQAYLGVAAIVLLVGLPSAIFLMRDAPRGALRQGESFTSPEGLSVREAVRKPVFWMILVSVAMGAGCLTAIFSHVAPMVGNRGYGLSVGTAVISCFALVCSFWQIITGRTLDWIATPRIVAPMYLMALPGLALLEFADSVWQLLLGGAFLGVALGCQYGSLAYFITRFFGLKHFGAIIGVMFSTIIAVQGVTPMLLDAVYDHQHSYRLAVIATGLCLAIGGGVLLLLPPYPKSEAKANLNAVQPGARPA